MLHANDSAKFAFSIRVVFVVVVVVYNHFHILYFQQKTIFAMKERGKLRVISSEFDCTMCGHIELFVLCHSEPSLFFFSFFLFHFFSIFSLEMLIRFIKCEQNDNKKSDNDGNGVDVNGVGDAGRTNTQHPQHMLIGRQPEMEK